MPDTEDLVSSISGIFQAAEDKIIQRIAYGLSSGTESPDTWAQQKALELRAMQSQVQKDIGKLDSTSNDAIQSSIFSAWKDASGDDFLSKATISALPKNYNSVLSLARDTTSRVSSMGNHILRTTDDVYRQAVQAAAGQVSLGLSTLDDAVYDTVDRMAKQGITGFVDKAGRNWGMDTYAEMAVRTATQRASIDAHVDKLRRLGQNLVKVSDAYGECSLCRPWEGKVLSISGDDDPEAVATISQATDAGLFHPGCRHRVVVYIPGMPTTVPEARPEPKVAEAEARQRQIERTAREWDRREKAARAAGNDDGAAYAHKKLLAWRKEAKSHAESSGIARRTKAERAFTLKEREIEQETLKKAGKQFDEITDKLPEIKISNPKVVKPEPVKPVSVDESDYSGTAVFKAGDVTESADRLQNEVNHLKNGTSPLDSQYTLAEREAIEKYTDSTEFFKVKKAFNDGDDYLLSDGSSAFSNLDSAIEKTTLEDNATVYRMLKLPKADVDAMTQGRTLKNDFYMSTTPDYTGAKAYGAAGRGKQVMLKILVPKGSHAIPGDRNIQEAIFSRNSELQIVRTTTVRGKPFVVAVLREPEYVKPFEPRILKPKVVKPEPVKPKVFKPAPVPPNYVISELRQIPKDVKHAQRELADIDEYLISEKDLGKDYRDVFAARKRALVEWIDNGQDDAVLKRTEAFDRTWHKAFEERSAKLEAAQKEAIKAAKKAPVRTPVEGADYFASADGHKLNPHYEDADGRGKINCMMCTSTAEIRARGGEVVAAVNDVDLEHTTYTADGVVMSVTGQAVNQIQNFEKLFKGDRIFKKTTSKTRLLRELDSYPDGSRSAVTVVWDQGSAHIFSITKRDGRTWITDMQDGFVTAADSTKADRYWGHVKWTVGAKVMRIDDLELDMEQVKSFKWTEKA